MLSRLFPSWVRFAGSAIEWLWSRRGADGYWDFGPRPHSVAVLPFSDDWRAGRNRRFDWSTRVLVLLGRYHAGNPGRPRDLPRPTSPGTTALQEGRDLTCPGE